MSTMPAVGPGGHPPPGHPACRTLRPPDPVMRRHEARGPVTCACHAVHNLATTPSAAPPFLGVSGHSNLPSKWGAKVRMDDGGLLARLNALVELVAARRGLYLGPDGRLATVEARLAADALGLDGSPATAELLRRVAEAVGLVRVRGPRLEASTLHRAWVKLDDGLQAGIVYAAWCARLPWIGLIGPEPAVGVLVAARVRILRLLLALPAAVTVDMAGLAATVAAARGIEVGGAGTDHAEVGGTRVGHAEEVGGTEVGDARFGGAGIGGAEVGGTRMGGTRVGGAGLMPALVTAFLEPLAALGAAELAPAAPAPATHVRFRPQAHALIGSALVALGEPVALATSGN